MNQRIYITFIIVLTAMLMLSGCAGPATERTDPIDIRSESSGYFDIAELGEGLEIKSAGALLMDLDLGMTKVGVSGDENDSVLVVLVHGYASQGYEWVHGLRGMVQQFGSSYFFRYDWERCPDDIATSLAQKVKDLQASGKYKRTLIFGHSYGGLILAHTASQLGRSNAELHIIAAPLTGFPNLLEQCDDLAFNDKKQLEYPAWHQNVRVIQHRTVHAQDGAFRDLERDPQVIELPFAQVYELPPVMDGHRLGHNWSVTWVLDKYLGRPHRR